MFTSNTKSPDMNYLQNFNWRYATKRMNGKAVPADQLNNILEATRLAPTSLGLQPFDVLVIQDPELRASLSPAIYNQPQVTEGSALLVFAAWKNIAPEQIDEYMDNIATTRNIPIESLNDFRKETGKPTEYWSGKSSFCASTFGIH